MSYSFPKNSPNGEEVTLENGVTYKYNSLKKSWEILDNEDVMPKSGGIFTGNVEIDTSGESDDTEAGLKLKGSRSNATNSVGTITFENEQSTAPGYLTYRSYDDSTFFRLNQDLDLKDKGLHSAGEIRMKPDGSIGAGSNTRLTFHNANTGQDGDGLLVVPRPFDNRRSFAIRGNDADGVEQDMLYTFTNVEGTPDAINYLGKMDSDKNLVNKEYVDSKSQSSSKSPVLMHSGAGNVYSYTNPGSLNDNQFTSDSYQASGSTLYIFRLWHQKRGWTAVVNYDCTENSTIEIWEADGYPPELIVRAGIREITQSQESQHDAKILLDRFWSKSNYSFNKYRQYTFMLHGLVERDEPLSPLSATFDLSDDAELMKKTKQR